MFSLLYQNRVELLLSGHDHTYQRFAPLNPSGAVDQQAGVVQIVVGTGGASHYGFTNSSPAPVVRNNTSYGVVALTLTATGWSSGSSPRRGPAPRRGQRHVSGRRGVVDLVRHDGADHGFAGAWPDHTGARLRRSPRRATVGPSVRPSPSSGTHRGAGVNRVRVNVRNQATLQWLQDNGTFGSTFRQFGRRARLAGATSTTWTLTSPLPNASYGVGAKAVDTGGRAEAVTPWVTFAVNGARPPPRPDHPDPDHANPRPRLDDHHADHRPTHHRRAQRVVRRPMGVLGLPVLRRPAAVERHVALGPGAAAVHGLRGPLRPRGAGGRLHRARRRAGTYYTNQTIAAVPDPTRRAWPRSGRSWPPPSRTRPPAWGWSTTTRSSRWSSTSRASTPRPVSTPAGVTYSGGFNENLFVDQPSWSLMAAGPTPRPCARRAPRTAT